MEKIEIGYPMTAFDGPTTDEYQSSKACSSYACRRCDIAIKCTHGSKSIKYKIVARYKKDDEDSEITLKAETTKLYTDTEADTEYIVGAYERVWIEVKNEVVGQNSSAKVWLNMKGA